MASMCGISLRPSDTYKSGNGEGLTRIFGSSLGYDRFRIHGISECSPEITPNAWATKAWNIPWVRYAFDEPNVCPSYEGKQQRYGVMKQLEHLQYSGRREREVIPFSGVINGRT